MYCRPTWLQMLALKGSQNSVWTRQRNPSWRVKCTTRIQSCHRLWWCAWTILWRSWAFQNRFFFAYFQVETSKKLATSSSEILLIEAIIPLKLLNTSFAWKSSILTESHFWEETTNPGTFLTYKDKLQLCMDFMTRSTENTVIPTLGNIVQKYSTICQSELSLMVRHFVSMEVSVRKSRQLTRLEQSIEKYKFLTRDHFVTWCGQILKTLRTGLSMQEAQDGCSVLK